MKAIFIDCNDQMDEVLARVQHPGDPPIVINTKRFEPEELPCLLDGYEICLDDHSYMPTDVVAKCSSLKHIVFLGTGAASYMNVEELGQLGVTVHTIKGYGDTAVAEHTIGLMFACARDISGMDRNIRAGTWSPREGMQLQGKTLGLVGLGGIGREVARIARGIGMEVIAWNRTPRLDAKIPLVDVDALLTNSDVISLHLSLNEETRGFLDAARLARIRRGCILVNTARGALVDETALVDALASGRIRHAGLDVFHQEPLRPDHPLSRLDNVTLSAHAAFRTVEASMTLLRRALDIVRHIVDNPAGTLDQAASASR
jgi:D-3-phosphoglycerate dehydrogenase